MGVRRSGLGRRGARDGPRLARHLDAEPALSLQDVAYTLQIGREPMEFRAAFVASDRAALTAALRAFSDTGTTSGTGAWTGHPDGARRDPADPLPAGLLEPAHRGHAERVRAYTDLLADELGIPAEAANKLAAPRTV